MDGLEHASVGHALELIDSWGHGGFRLRALRLRRHEFWKNSREHSSRRNLIPSEESLIQEIVHV